LLIMAAFIGFFLVIGLGFDYFYLNFSPVKTPDYIWNDAGYHEPRRAAGNIPFGTVIALLVGFGMTANGMMNGAKMVLRSTMARPADPGDEKERQLLNVVSEMAVAAGAKAPAAYIVPDRDLNAFAAGINPENSVIAVTEGLLGSLNREELQAVVAHEMSHIRNYDMRLMTVSAALMGAIALLSDLTGRTMRSRSLRGGAVSRSAGSRDRGGAGPVMALAFALWLVLVILAPVISRMLAMAISREREFLADASGVELTRNPLALVSALEKIRAAVTPTYAINNGVAHMCITDPRGSLLEDKAGLAADLFATHPPLQKRILALKVMAYQREQEYKST